MAASEYEAAVDRSIARLCAGLPEDPIRCILATEGDGSATVGGGGDSMAVEVLGSDVQTPIEVHSSTDALERFRDSADWPDPRVGLQVGKGRVGRWTLLHNVPTRLLEYDEAIDNTPLVTIRTDHERHAWDIEVWSPAPRSRVVRRASIPIEEAVDSLQFADRELDRAHGLAPESHIRRLYRAPLEQDATRMLLTEHVSPTTLGGVEGLPTPGQDKDRTTVAVDRGGCLYSVDGFQVLRVGTGARTSWATYRLSCPRSGWLGTWSEEQPVANMRREAEFALARHIAQLQEDAGWFDTNLVPSELSLLRREVQGTLAAAGWDEDWLEPISVRPGHTPVTVTPESLGADNQELFSNLRFQWDGVRYTVGPLVCLGRTLIPLSSDHSPITLRMSMEPDGQWHLESVDRKGEVGDYRKAIPQGLLTYFNRGIVPLGEANVRLALARILDWGVLKVVAHHQQNEPQAGFITDNGAELSHEDGALTAWGAASPYDVARARLEAGHHCSDDGETIHCLRIQGDDVSSTNIYQVTPESISEQIARSLGSSALKGVPVPGWDAVGGWVGPKDEAALYAGDHVVAGVMLPIVPPLFQGGPDPLVRLETGDWWRVRHNEGLAGGLPDLTGAPFQLPRPAEPGTYRVGPWQKASEPDVWVRAADPPIGRTIASAFKQPDGQWVVRAADFSEHDWHTSSSVVLTSADDMGAATYVADYLLACALATTQEPCDEHLAPYDECMACRAEWQRERAPRYQAAAAIDRVLESAIETPQDTLTESLGLDGWPTVQVRDCTPERARDVLELCGVPQHWFGVMLECARTGKAPVVGPEWPRIEVRAWESHSRVVYRTRSGLVAVLMDQGGIHAAVVFGRPTEEIA